MSLGAVRVLPTFTPNARVNRSGHLWRATLTMSATPCIHCLSFLHPSNSNSRARTARE